MDLLKVLVIPFQFSSLAFVAFSSFFLGIIIGSGNFVTQLMGLAAVWATLVWLTRYAFRMVDDIANGVREAAAAEVEMANVFLGDARSLVHPVLALALIILCTTQPQVSPMLVLVICAVLFPASIAACAMSGYAHDAFNPVAIGRVILGMGPWYAVAVLVMAGCAAAGVGLSRVLSLGWLLFALLELLLLVAYAALGGLIYMRRWELGFEARITPERREMAANAARELERQKVFDRLYKQIGAREVASAAAEAGEWLRKADALQLHEDVRALIAAGRQWNLPRPFVRLLHELLPLLIRQPATAQLAADAALAADPAFAPAGEPTVVALVEYALQTGRRRTAARLLENFLAAAPGAPGPRLQALRQRLQAVAPQA